MHPTFDRVLSNCESVEIIELPYVERAYKSFFHFGKYYTGLLSLKGKIDYIYCRVPDPFAWMPRLMFNYKTVMHFVGDSIDATKNDEHRSFLKKTLLIAGYFPTYCLVLLAAKQSRVCVNGNHLVERLKKFDIEAIPVISSTIKRNDLDDNFPILCIDDQCIHLIYVGYIRFAKGMKLLMRLWLILKKKYPHFKFDVVGDGEMFVEISQFVSDNDLANNVFLHRHIDYRKQINKLLRSAHLFIFPSLSEGSPRVVIEAMAQGILVISTPVGSLPTVFKDQEEIRFFDFNDDCKALSIIDEYILSKDDFEIGVLIYMFKHRREFTIEWFFVIFFFVYKLGQSTSMSVFGLRQSLPGILCIMFL